MTDHSEIDSVTGRATTGHEWDGIKELNTPLPRWWVICFYLTIVWAIGYWIVYPAWPLISSNTTGLLGYSTRASLAVELANLEAVRGEKMATLAAASLADIEKDPALLALARAKGKTVFGDNCAPCHGSGGAGAKGFPNLNDDDWLWGGTLDQIMQTIRFGARSTHADTHPGQMLAFGKDGVLKPDEIVTVANYVRSLSGLPTRPGYDVAKGKKIFAENCVACHGDDAKGNQELGAPNLTDKIWLYGSDEATLIETISNGRAGVMPAWEGRLDPATIKAMAVYVHSLGGGK
ncbi:cytochrome-c oxidase, cbb3-type subunit III [Bradyrhizobium diazoefficiens]|uniref:cytochrome-c oxidase, cbb3-type subunit III n=1 Tax=Bradyrhizobium diazoefficiens TaxID=1355477 RepID=UPI00190D7E0A|nr:cytochrome-c oxidase, cbb3-type subunit III [Bradyrhizobium diazoefficiens]MBK3664674.1 cytochrome-c oxidase, cbb3-type subunit III [Bradyrhizobium diazoefficiens]